MFPRTPRGWGWGWVGPPPQSGSQPSPPTRVVGGYPSLSPGPPKKTSAWCIFFQTPSQEHSRGRLPVPPTVPPPMSIGKKEEGPLVRSGFGPSARTSLFFYHLDISWYASRFFLCAPCAFFLFLFNRPPVMLCFPLLGQTWVDSHTGK